MSIAKMTRDIKGSIAIYSVSALGPHSPEVTKAAMELDLLRPARPLGSAMTMLCTHHFYNHRENMPIGQRAACCQAAAANGILLTLGGSCCDRLHIPHSARCLLYICLQRTPPKVLLGEVEILSR